MRYLFMVLMCLMFVFAVVQYNDPDGVQWMAIYSVPAFWCAVAVFSSNLLGSLWAKVALLASITASLAGVVWFWPLSPRFWTKDVWYNVETAREGMGMMIVFVVLLLVFVLNRQQHGSVERGQMKVT